MPIVHYRFLPVMSRLSRNINRSPDFCDCLVLLNSPDQAPRLHLSSLVAYKKDRLDKVALSAIICFGYPKSGNEANANWRLVSDPTS